ncbi:hypothetical protein XENOCAPTIV_029558 [Xenoophorus captivus]|uniref:Cytosol aminopeptidase domain-containing protein n=1 Tax=Xenoophorus captivus TaxID=1517983 RepID=A0ABV0RVN1_9TELE
MLVVKKTVQMAVRKHLSRSFSATRTHLQERKVTYSYPHQDFPCVAVVGLGKDNEGVCGAENWDTKKENIRHAVSEGAVLGLFCYDQLKSKKKTRVTTQLHGRPKAWIEEQQMGAFLSVTRGSEEPPVFLELYYNGCPDKKQLPLMLVGKGITFDRLTIKTLTAAHC